MKDTVAEREQAALRALYEQEDFVRSLGHLTDEELTQQLVVQIGLQKKVVNRWLDSGDCFIISGAGKIHLPSCPSMLRFVDRDFAWTPYLRHLERVRDWHGSDNAPDMPTFLTRADAESLKRYTVCPNCAPTLDHTEKRSGVKGWTSLKAGSLKSKHFGTVFSLADGTEIGALTRISKQETIEGLEFTAEFEGHSPVTDPETALMYRTGLRSDDDGTEAIKS
ncbi:UNVERIFIED_ORG: hypothetical protein ABIB13_002212 [Arthrobacter sp. UYEF2]